MWPAKGSYEEAGNISSLFTSLSAQSDEETNEHAVSCRASCILWHTRKDTHPELFSFTRKSEHLVQKAFLCSKTFGFLMNITVFWLCYNNVENHQLIFELYLLQYICIYIIVNICVYYENMSCFFLYRMCSQKVPFYCECLAQGRTCNLMLLHKPSADIYHTFDSLHLRRGKSHS